MNEEPLGPFVFDASAESWLARSESPEVQHWLVSFLERHPTYVSAVTVIERLTDTISLSRKLRQVRETG